MKPTPHYTTSPHSIGARLRIGVMCSTVLLPSLALAADDTLTEIPQAARVSEPLTGTIEGVVRSTTEPLAGATVSMIRTTGKDAVGGSVAEIQYQTVTGPDGRFQISSIAPEKYTVIVQYPGLRASALDAAFSSNSINIHHEVMLIAP